MFTLHPSFWRAAVVAMAIGLLSPLASLAAPLTESDAVRLGLSRPELADLTQARIAEADADVVAAGTWANPSLEFSRDKTGASRESTWRLAQPLDVSGRRGLRQDAARLRLDATEADTRAWREERVAELRRSFYDVLRQQSALRIIDAWMARFAVIGNVVDKLARVGDASGYDRRRLSREQQAADAKAAEARAGLERSRARLTALLGQPAMDQDVAGTLLPTLPSGLPGLQARLAQRPDLAALAARADAANADNAATQRNFPELTVGVGGKRTDDGVLRDNGTVFSVSIPLPIFDRQQGAERRTSAQAMAARAEYTLAKQKAEGDLIGLHRQLVQLIAAAERYRREAVAPSADLVRIAEAAYRAGESTVLELLDAYKGALEAETIALDLEWKARELRIELDQLTGNHPQ
jgi:cobalt-zinc-cadmium efflux system outer membrane protein